MEGAQSSALSGVRAEIEMGQWAAQPAGRYLGCSKNLLISPQKIDITAPKLASFCRSRIRCYWEVQLW
jgi:hypothetical protein